MGSAMQATGTEGDCFLGEKSALPYYPAHLPLTHRQTFWRLTPFTSEDGPPDCIIASLYQLCNAFCAALTLAHSNCAERYLAFLEVVKAELLCEARGGQRQNGSLEKGCAKRHGVFATRVAEYFRPSHAAVWLQRSSDCARRIVLQDYHSLAELAHYRFLGKRTDDGGYDGEMMVKVMIMVLVLVLVLVSVLVFVLC